MSVHISKSRRIATKSVTRWSTAGKIYCWNILEDDLLQQRSGMLGYTGVYKGEQVSVKRNRHGHAFSEYLCPWIDQLLRRERNWFGSVRVVPSQRCPRAWSCDCPSGSNKFIDGSKNCFHFPPIADFALLRKAYDTAIESGYDPRRQYLIWRYLLQDDMTETLQLADLGWWVLRWKPQPYTI